jgi:hypothetical protein
MNSKIRVELSDFFVNVSLSKGGSAKVEIFAHIPEIKIHLSSWRGIEQPIVSIQINDIQAECYLRKNEVIDVWSSLRLHCQIFCLPFLL